VDTDKDPYNINRGFFWAHMGWLLVKQDPAKIGKTDTKDLDNDPLILFQDRYYMPLAFLSGWIIPTLIAGLVWGDWRGGFVYASLLRCVFVLQATFCINSLAHFVGVHTFDDRRTPRDSWWVSLVTFGEGYHNFHHEFPYDYRNGVNWYAYDPSKWVVYLMSFFGLTFDLKRFPDNEIWKGALQMVEKNAAKMRAKLNWGPDPISLPFYTMDEVEKRTQEGSSLMVIEGQVYDLTGFSHPGGEKFIKVKLGKDATGAFNGEVYNHSNGARNLMSQMLVGRIKQKDQ
jgi:stearoyl-CoA desaturase (delta-9 desaturase)